MRWIVSSVVSGLEAFWVWSHGRTGKSIDQLEGMVANQDLSRRAEVLRRVTDLFVHGSGKFSEEQIELFDEVMSKLVENIELAARAALGDRLALFPDAPGRVIRALAFDDAIEV